MKGPKLNEFGKYCRILRILNSEILGDMAQKLGVTVSYLSAVENGKREVPEKFIKLIPELYHLQGEDLSNFIDAVERSRKKVLIDLDSLEPDGKAVIVALAKKIEDSKSSDETKDFLDSIYNLLNK